MICSKCSQDKPPEAFYVRRDGRTWTICRVCRRVQIAEYRRLNPDVAKRATRKYYTSEHGKIKRRAREKAQGKGRLRQTGFTPEMYAAILAEQEGVCAICKAPPRKKSLHADHCHTTGKPRMLLCARCNMAVGFLEDPMRPLWERYLNVNPSMLETVYDR